MSRRSSSSSTPASQNSSAPIASTPKTNGSASSSPILSRTTIDLPHDVVSLQSQKGLITRSMTKSLAPLQSPSIVRKPAPPVIVTVPSGGGGWFVLQSGANSSGAGFETADGAAQDAAGPIVTNGTVVHDLANGSAPINAIEAPYTSFVVESDAGVDSVSTVLDEAAALEHVEAAMKEAMNGNLMSDLEALSSAASTAESTTPAGSEETDTLPLESVSTFSLETGTNEASATPDESPSKEILTSVDKVTAVDLTEESRSTDISIRDHVDVEPIELSVIANQTDAANAVLVDQKTEPPADALALAETLVLTPESSGSSGEDDTIAARDVVPDVPPAAEAEIQPLITIFRAPTMPLIPKPSEIVQDDVKPNQTVASFNEIPRLSFRKQANSFEKRQRCREVLDVARHFFRLNNAEVTLLDDSQILSSSISTDTSAAFIDIVPQAPSPSKALSVREFRPVTVACGFPVHMNEAVFRAVVEFSTKEKQLLKEAVSSPSLENDESLARKDEEEEVPTVVWDHFERFILSTYSKYFPDLEALSFNILATDPSAGIVPTDFEIIIKDILETHPAFDFLNGSDAFQARFTETVIARLFYLNPRIGKNRMTLREFRKLNLLPTLNEVEAATSCLGASMPSPFSYKDFYVIYCKFWELDRDRDMLVNAIDLEFYGRRALSRAAVSRVIECHGCRDEHAGYLGFKEFVTFILSVEDKTTDSALDYWFRVLDLDEDGVLSLLELETFWEHQQHRLPEHYRIEDFFSLALDLVRPGSISLTLMDLKRSRTSAGLLFDMLLDSRRHNENVRRSTDGAFRFRDEVWLETEGEGSASDSDDSASFDSQGIRRHKLEGWEKFSERAYRDLANPGPSAASGGSSSYSVSSRADGVALSDDEEDDEDHRAAVAAASEFDDAMPADDIEFVAVATTAPHSDKDIAKETQAAWYADENASEATDSGVNVATAAPVEDHFESSEVGELAST
ncbi:hypothetical protein DFJ73DRAFT_758352 [Zopfochytrium polystomum]|nr:hypothetical protein DFJ73DRAFT_758352 [Zopfochytrium polystomum]